ncbi:MAG TPA: phosphate acyltransferase PlsX [Acidimicrobiales bacterium]|nr:phosphate acyltransferase PlsX [Acidimicrobiales bacterium]
MSEASETIVIAIDAVGGDNAPGAIVAGAQQAAAELGVPIVLVGPPDQVGDTGGLELIACTEVIDMKEEGARAVRRKKDSSLVRCAELVRDGQASAMLSAGNTGATVASALLRMGRAKGVNRPAIATPIPVPGTTPTVLLDAGANAEVQPAWLVQFAQMGTAYARARYGLDTPRVGLLNIGEEESKGNDLAKEAHGLLRDAPGINFIGNVEGRDLMSDDVDVVVTDGFTGNVALKTLEGGMKFLRDAVFTALVSTEEAIKASEVVLPLLLPLAEELDPDTHGGAMALGLNGVCIIGHGSSSAKAIVNAVKVARDMVEGDLVAKVARAVAAGAGEPADSPAG